MRSPAEAAPGRLYLPDLATAGPRFELPADEAHYVRRVIRVRAGQWLEGTDGRGAVARLVVLDVGARVEVEVERLAAEPRPAASTLCCGAPEGERGDWLIEKLAELGVGRFVPVDTARASWRGTRRERWERLATAALRQSRGAWRIELSEPRALADAVADAGGDRWLADPEGDPPGPSAPGAVERTGCVGPSPGFTPEERDALRAAGFRPVRLAAARLRTETAALAMAAVWAAGTSFGPAGVDGPQARS